MAFFWSMVFLDVEGYSLREDIINLLAAYRRKSLVIATESRKHVASLVQGILKSNTSLVVVHLELQKPKAPYPLADDESPPHTSFWNKLRGRFYGTEVGLTDSRAEYRDFFTASAFWVLVACGLIPGLENHQVANFKSSAPYSRPFDNKNRLTSRYLMTGSVKLCSTSSVRLTSLLAFHLSCLP
jgi:hypothetical protein